MLCVLSAERDSSFSMYISETVACKFPQSKSAARADSGRRVPWPPLALHTLLLLLPTTTAATTAGATSDAFADTSTTVSASPPGQKEPKRELKGAKAVQGLSWQRPRSQIFILLQLCSLLDFCESAIFLQVESAFWVDCSSWPWALCTAAPTQGIPCCNSCLSLPFPLPFVLTLDSQWLDKSCTKILISNQQQ